jgi:molybdopterin/thiamine biosynthesis adenylyltransferase
MTDARYARQIAVPGVGKGGQHAVAHAEARVLGSDLAAEVCALYLAGAGIGTLHVARALSDRCVSLNSAIEVIASDERNVDALAVEVSIGGARARFAPPPSGDQVRDGSCAARWVLARILSKRTAVS